MLKLVQLRNMNFHYVFTINSKKKKIRELMHYKNNGSAVFYRFHFLITYGECKKRNYCFLL